MYCPNCAYQIHNNTKFCTRCGTNLDAISKLLNGTTIEPPQSEEMIKLLERCHNGYLSTVIGLGLVITSLLIVIAAIMSGVPLAAMSSLVFLGWAIPAIAQGVGKWLSAKSEMRSILKRDVESDDESQKKLSSEGVMADSRRFAGSVTEGTTASLNQRT